MSSKAQSISRDSPVNLICDLLTVFFFSVKGKYSVFPDSYKNIELKLYFFFLFIEVPIILDMTKCPVSNSLCHESLPLRRMRGDLSSFAQVVRKLIFFSSFNSP